MRLRKSAFLGLLALAALGVESQAATCSYKVDSEWNTGFSGSITIANTGTTAVSGWSVSWSYAKNKITSSWNATLSGTNPYSASNLDWNKMIQPGQSVSFGFQGDKNGATAAEVVAVTGSVCGSASSASSVSSIASSVASSAASSSKSSVANSAVSSSKSSSVSSSVSSCACGVSSSSRASSSSSRASSSSLASSSSSSASSTPVTDASDDWLHTDGNHVVDKNGKAVWMTGANWFGFNCTERVFHGLWSVNLDSSLKAIADRGINLIRVPISTQLILEWKNGKAATTGINTYVNPELNGKTSLEIFDAFLAGSKKYGIKVLMDLHSAEADNAGHVYPVWYKGSFGAPEFYDAWTWMATRYKNDDTILIFDLKNEPHGFVGDSQGNAKWDNSTDVNNWKSTAEEAAKRILAVHPNVLILVEGVEFFPKDGKTWTSTNKSDYYGTWWGGNLRAVATLPITVAGGQKQIMYSPHDYGPAVFQQTWFYSGFNKDTLYKDVWHDNWLFIHEQKIAPLLIGEWGGFMDGGSNEAWMKAMRDLIVQYKLHHTFWDLNPDSGDTGGLWLNDWVSWDEPKYALLKPSLWQSAGGKFVGLDHKVGLGANGLSVTAYYAAGGTEPVGQ